MHALRETEVLIVGGGPAGLAAAIALRRAGLDVTVADAAQPPIDKACGEGILPQGVAALGELGIELGLGNAAQFRGIRFLQPGISASACFSAGFGYGIRRTTLHHLLVDRAAKLGVSLCWGARVQGIGGGVASICGLRVRYRWLIGADGQKSQIRDWIGLGDGQRVRRRFGFRRHFEAEPWSEFVDVHWSDCGQLYVSPVGANEVCVAFITGDPRLRFRDAFALFPDVAHRLKRPTSRELGAVTATRGLRSVCVGNCALIGEASGSVDAVTGEGLSMAFRQALALAEALRTNDIQSYQRSHRRIARVPRVMAHLLLLMDRHPALRQRVLRTFSAKPVLFERMLAIHSES
jgi:flavin-dependent dehydrogenase